MKTSRQLSFILFVIMISLYSCTMEKRVYRSGYHIEWHNRKDNPNKIDLARKDNFNKSNDSEIEIINRKELPTIKSNTTSEKIAASAVNSKKLANLKPISINQKDFYCKKKLNPHQIGIVEDCDVLTFRNGDELEVKVIEIDQSTIKYKKCDNLNGPTFSIRKSEVLSIKYPNGTKDIINSSNSSYNPTSSDGDKSLIATVMLWFFLGLLGIHRFYIGHIGMGVLYLLTAGLCGIGWLVDGILLFTGGLKPRNGNFTDSFF
ncbi:MAG: TM2 domain-containing protein [Bacteroidia bacterium]